MSAARELKTRIQTVKNIQNVTDAIQKIASARVSKAKNKAVNLKKYVKSYADAAYILRQKIEEHPFFSNNNITETELYIIVTGDKGLCGGFYSRIFEFTNELFKNKDRTKLDLIALGKKGISYYNKKNYRILLNRVNFPVFCPKEYVKEIGNIITDKFINNHIKSASVIYNRYISAARYETVVKQLLPIQFDDDQKKPGKNNIYLFEPEAETLASDFFPDYIKTLIWQGIIESVAGEQTSRMINMERASHSAKDMIEDLTKQKNKSRQSAITKELSEIVGTADALENE